MYKAGRMAVIISILPFGRCVCDALGIATCGRRPPRVRICSVDRARCMHAFFSACSPSVFRPHLSSCPFVPSRSSTPSTPANPSSLSTPSTLSTLSTPFTLSNRLTSSTTSVVPLDILGGLCCSPIICVLSPPDISSLPCTLTPFDLQPVSLQHGGGKSTRNISVGKLHTFLSLAGTLAGLDPDDSVRVRRLLNADEDISCNRDQVVIAVPPSVIRNSVSREEILRLVRTHGITIGRERDLPLLRDKIHAHVCTSSCPLDAWLFTRPLYSAIGKFRNTLSSSADGRLPFSIETVPVQFQFLEPIVPQHFVAPPDFSPVPNSGGYVPVSKPVPARFPPRPLTRDDVADIIRDWVADCSAKALAEAPCAVCAQLVATQQLRSLSLNDNWTDIVVQSAARSLPHTRSRTATVLDVLCHDAVNFVTGTAAVCRVCYNALVKRRTLPRLSLANGLWLGEQPCELSDLTFIEKQMVARYRHNHSIVTVRGCGAAKMHCNAVVFSQPVAEFRRVLPPPRAELCELIGVLFIGPTAPTERDFARVPFLIRRQKVLAALEWLRKHHPDYVDLEISRENLGEYPEDAPPVAWCYEKGDGAPESNALAVSANDEERGVADGPCPFAVHGISPDGIANVDYATRKAVTTLHLRSGGQILGYGHSAQPESIFHNRKMLPGLFPWLFPYGLGGLENENATISVPRRSHIRWFMNYVDRRFQVDDYFPFLVFNQQQIRASSKGGFALIERSNYPEVVEKLLNLNADALSDMVARGKANGHIKPVTDAEKKCYEVLSMINHVAQDVPCSTTKKKHQRNEIRSLIYAYGVPMFFITFSPSESKSKICLHFCGMPIDLDDYLPMASHDKDRLRTVVSNPAACAKFFNLMVNLFIKHVLRADTGRDGAFGRTSAYYGTVEQQGRTTLHLHLLLWIEGSCSPQLIRERALEQNGKFASEIITWLEACHQGEFSTGPESASSVGT